MFKFLSQTETRPAPDRLVPYGIGREAIQFHDAIAGQEQERARSDGRAFGRRTELPQTPKLLRRKLPAERVKYFSRAEARTH